MNNSSKDLERVMEACASTAKACAEAVKYGLEKGGEVSESRLIIKLFDCAQLCRACGDACSSGNGKAASSREACARACDEAAIACEKSGDSQLASTAKILRQCAQACRQETAATAS